MIRTLVFDRLHDLGDARLEQIRVAYDRAAQAPMREPTRALHAAVAAILASEQERRREAREPEVLVVGLDMLEDLSEAELVTVQGVAERYRMALAGDDPIASAFFATIAAVLAQAREERRRAFAKIEQELLN